jgi:hypothetical protein
MPKLLARHRTSVALLAGSTQLSAAIQDTGATVENFGEGAGGQLDAIRA